MKVNFKFAIYSKNDILLKYFTKTVEMNIPTDKNGFMIPDLLNENINAYIKTILFPTISNNYYDNQLPSYFRILYHQIKYK